MGQGNLAAGSVGADETVLPPPDPVSATRNPMMNKLTLNPEQLQVDSFETELRVQDAAVRRAWSDDSVCPNTNPSERRVCV
jgi:hypothetical protein